MLERTGHLESRRKEQTRRWMWTMVEERLMRALREHPAVAALAPEIERSVLAGQLTPALGAEALMQAFGLPTT